MTEIQLLFGDGRRYYRAGDELLNIFWFLFFLTFTKRCVKCFLMVGHRELWSFTGVEKPHKGLFDFIMLIAKFGKV